ncbi:MAG: polyprenyl diphosphate synthase, partial [Elusimicrobiota bacterium]
YTAGCKKMVLNLCLNYGSRQEIVAAFNKMAEAGIKKTDEETLSKYLFTGSLPDPDLLIRTSGEQRVSNFFLWQIAYSEIYFTKVLWPDFDTAELYKAIIDYQSRERRFGGI